MKLSFSPISKRCLKDYLNSCTKLKASTLVWNWIDKKKKHLKQSWKVNPINYQTKKKKFVMEQKS